MADDEDRPRDASSAADHSWADGEDLTVLWSNAVAPDDIRELAVDVKAYRREQRAERRRTLIGKVLARPGATPLGVIAIALVLAALVATFVAVVIPTTTRSPSPLPLAKTNALAVNHGLLPIAPLTSGTNTVMARSLRPAVVAEVPDPCNCRALLNQYAAAARTKHVPLVVVAPPHDAEVAALTGRLDQGRVTVYSDAQNVLATAVKATGLTLVVVARDGTVFSIARSVTAQRPSNLTVSLSEMLAATGSAD
jgi:hypothetical protein